MARGYPRFLFSNPKNTKTEGPYIVHCLEPRLIFKVLIENPIDFKLVLLDKAPSPDLETPYGEVWKDATIWFSFQLKQGSIIL